LLADADLAVLREHAHFKIQSDGHLGDTRVDAMTGDQILSARNTYVILSFYGLINQYRTQGLPETLSSQVRELLVNTTDTDIIQLREEAARTAIRQQGEMMCAYVTLFTPWKLDAFKQSIDNFLEHSV